VEYYEQQQYNMGSFIVQGEERIFICITAAEMCTTHLVVSIDWLLMMMAVGRNELAMNRRKEWPFSSAFTNEYKWSIRTEFSLPLSFACIQR
jgi:hypothetical protein